MIVKSTAMFRPGFRIVSTLLFESKENMSSLVPAPAQSKEEDSRGMGWGVAGKIVIIQRFSTLARSEVFSIPA